jgi:hypothetical protein
LDNVMKSANELSVENLVKSALSHLWNKFFHYF